MRNRSIGGCILLPLLWNGYSENQVKEQFQQLHHAIRINCELFNNLRYADESVLFTDSAEALQQIIYQVAAEYDRYGMTINGKRTQVQIVSKTNIANTRFYEIVIELQHHTSWL